MKYTGITIKHFITQKQVSSPDAYALAETINGLYKTEVIHSNHSWKGKADVEFATLEWVHWFNCQRIFEPLGYISPARYEKAYYNQLEESALLA